MNSRESSMLIAALCVAVVRGPASGQATCSGYWASTNIPSANISEMAAFDDGTGPALYARSDTIVRKWTGQAWQPLPTTGWGATVQQLYDLSVMKTADGDRLSVIVQRRPTGSENPYPGVGNTEAVPMVFKGEHWEPPVNHHLFKNVFSVRYCNVGEGATYYGLTWIVNPATFTVEKILVRRWSGDGWVTIGVTGLTGGDVAYLRDLDFGEGRCLYLWGVGENPGFSTINGIPALGLAKWDGQQWTAPWPERVSAGGYERFAEMMEGGQPVLYGMFFARVNGVLTKGVGRYDGTSFRGIGGSELGPGQVGGATHVAAMDDGAGPRLFVTGAFERLTGGIWSPGIGKWDGTAWQAVGAGASSDVSNPTVLQSPSGPKMYMRSWSSSQFGGGAAPPNTLALYVGCPNCYANCDLSAKSPSLTANDFMCFMSKFLVRDPYANCTVDATIDIADFQCFISKFAAGCP